MTKHPDGESHPHEGHPHTKLAAEIAGAAGAAAIMGVAYNQWHKRHHTDTTYETATYPSRLRIFDDERLNPAVRDLLAPLAVRIHYATVNTAAKVIMRSQLVEQNAFAEAAPTHIKTALSYLKDKPYELIGRRPSMVDGREGYHSKPVLDWGINEGSIDSLAQAYAELIEEIRDANFFN